MTNPKSFHRKLKALPLESQAAWITFCSKGPTKEIQALLDHQSLEFLLELARTEGFEKAERHAGIAARSGKELLRLALHIIAAHSNNQTFYIK